MQAPLRTQPVLVTARLTVRLADGADVPAILDYFARNREFFAVTDPERPEDFQTNRFWMEQVARSVQEFHRDQSLRLFVFQKDGGGSRDRVIGAVGLTQIVRGPFQACYLGYGLDQACQGQGLMNEALSVAISYAFEHLNLHRIMAGYMPENVRSAVVLKRLGFVVEGQARDYLRIAGKWRDHVLTSLTHPAWRDPARP
jgi:ribosomal-protein-alanine N-acetyltransferase